MPRRRDKLTCSKNKLLFGGKKKVESEEVDVVKKFVRKNVSAELDKAGGSTSSNPKGKENALL